MLEFGGDIRRHKYHPRYLRPPIDTFHRYYRRQRYDRYYTSTLRPSYPKTFGRSGRRNYLDRNAIDLEESDSDTDLSYEEDRRMKRRVLDIPPPTDTDETEESEEDETEESDGEKPSKSESNVDNSGSEDLNAKSKGKVYGGVRPGGRDGIAQYVQRGKRHIPLPSPLKELNYEENRKMKRPKLGEGSKDCILDIKPSDTEESEESEESDESDESEESEESEGSEDLDAESKVTVDGEKVTEIDAEALKIMESLEAQKNYGFDNEMPVATAKSQEPY